MKFVSKVPVDNKPSLVQIMAWCRSGDEPLSEPMMVWFTDVYIHLNELNGANDFTGDCEPIAPEHLLSQLYFIYAN